MLNAASKMQSLRHGFA